MIALKQWVRDVMLILLLTYALELAIPFGPSRRYVRLGAGLILLLALLQPLLSLLRADFSQVLVEAAQTDWLDTEVEERLRLVQDAQAAAASRLGHRLGEEQMAEIGARHGYDIHAIDWDPSGRVTIWARAAAESDRGWLAAPPGVASGRFILEAAAALGVAAQNVEVRWLHGQEGTR